MQAKKQGSMGQIVALASVAVVLAIAYVALDRYTEGQKDMLTVETRGMNMIQALSRHRLQAGSYPDSLDKLVPKFAPAVSKCPDGQAMGYQLAGNEYTLSCQNVVFKAKPYTYSSSAKTWGG